LPNNKTHAVQRTIVYPSNVRGVLFWPRLVTASRRGI